MSIELIIFDCDGVLIDSEWVASRLIAAEMTRLGWAMDAAESMRLFLGMSISDMEPMIEARIGRALPAGWRQRIAGELLVALGTEAKLIDGAKEILEQVDAMGMDWRVASNSSDEEMAVKFARTGLSELTAGRAHSASSVIARGGKAKPAPDIFYAAAASACVTPENCLVIEDSPLGVRGAVAAGMVCYGYAPHGDGAHLKDAGARGIFKNLNELFGVLAW
jgi:HAD superfamily hydrolase (TIGR01509 family)